MREQSMLVAEEFVWQAFPGDSASRAKVS